MEHVSWDVAVIGGGPAGMMAAGRAAELGAKTVLIEQNPGLGKKLLITGGGRCNILNAEFDRHRLIAKYGKKGKALHSTFAAFDAEATWQWFTDHGLPLKVEPEQRAFPISDNAADVRAVLKRFMAQHGVHVLTDLRVERLVKSDHLITKIIHQDGELEAKNYILATGGKSHPETGSTGDGFRWAAELGHRVITPEAALVPLTVRDPWVRDVAGLSLRDVRLTLWQRDQVQEQRIGKMLFTHDGLSGPGVLNMSKRAGELLKAGPVTLTIDLYPALDPGALDRRMMASIELHKNKRIKNAIGDLTQSRLGHVLLALAKIDPETPLYRLTRDDRLRLGALLKTLPLSITGLLGEDRAIVTGGGVDLKEVDFSTMRSKRIANLSFAGDILDFDRPSGGFSLQICWSTGFVAGSQAAER